MYRLVTLTPHASKDNSIKYGFRQRSCQDALSWTEVFCFASAYMEFGKVRNRYKTGCGAAPNSSKEVVVPVEYNSSMLLGQEEPQAEIDRILESETFHSSTVLRRLISFLADKTFSGEADQLNEYAIGVDALGKPPTYDPRQDASVRLHVGRIRQKLGEYYRKEGKDDPVVIELPKGRFKLKWEMRSTPPAEVPKTGSWNAGRYRREAILVLAGALLVSTVWGISSTVQLKRARQNQTESVAWSPELEQLWHPFMTSKRPLIVAIADPLFFGFEGTDVYLRKVDLRRPEDAAISPELAALRRVLGNPAIQPRYSFIPTGEVMSSFLLGKLLGTRKQDFFLVRSSQVLLRGLAENDVVLIGPEIVFDQKLVGIQLQPELMPMPNGIRNLHPRAEEPEFFADAVSNFEPDNGEVYALVSRAPGPLGNNFESFTSARTWGRQGAIQAFTDPALARLLLQRIKTPSGEIPPYFQIVLKVKFRDTVPVNISYVMHRVITLLQ